MTGERTIEGWQLRLKSEGLGRYLSGAFLAFWLCGWLIGESIVLWILVKGALALLTGTPPEPGREPLDAGPALLTGLFMLVWLTLWTIGGIAAISELLRLLWGEDRITVSAGRLTVAWLRGPVRSARGFERDSIREITRVGREDRIALVTTAGRRVELSGLGSQAERIAGARALRAELGIPEAPQATATSIPDGWEEIITPEGERALVGNLSTRRAQARFAGAVTMVLATVTLALARESIRRPDLMIPAFILLAFTVGLTAGTLWLARGRWEWRIGSGRLTLRKRYGADVHDRFEARRLMIDSTTDSDGDAWYELLALTGTEPAPEPATPRWRPARPANSHTVARLMNDPAAVRALAGWLSRETGLELEDRTTPQAREIQLAELRAMLEKSGRFGQWAAKLVDRLGEGRKKAG